MNEPVFELERFVSDCRDALQERRTEHAMREVVSRAVSDPSAVSKALGEPKRAGIEKLHHAPDLTILQVIWGPQMTLMPHDHRMWAVIGIYAGREDNIFWRRIDEDPHGRIEAAGARALSSRDAVSLGRDIIHSVTNPIRGLTAAIHIYGGDFFAQNRSEWDPLSLRERPFDVKELMRIFEESNGRFRD